MYIDNSVLLTLSLCLIAVANPGIVLIPFRIVWFFIKPIVLMVYWPFKKAEESKYPDMALYATLMGYLFAIGALCDWIGV